MAGIGGVVIQFFVDSTKAVRGVKGVSAELGKVDDEAANAERALDDVQRELDAVGREADDTKGDLRQAETSLDSLGDEADSTADKVRRAALDMGDGMRDGARDVEREADGMRRDMGELGRETGSEFISNIAEGIGSGSGNLQDVISGTLGGLTNLAATLTGPVGLAAAGAAAGIGLVFNATRKAAEEAAARIDSIVEGLEEVEDQSKEAAEAKIFEIWLDQMKEMPGELRKTVKVLQTAQVTSEDWTQAVVGNEEAQVKVRNQIVKTGQEIIRNQQETGEITKEQQEYLDAIGPVLTLLDQQNGDLKDAKGLHEDINWLQGESKTKQEKVTREVRNTRDEAQGLERDLDDATKDRSVKVKVDYQERWVKGPGSGSGGSGYPHMAAFNTSTTTPAPVQPTTVIVTEEQVYRAISGLIMRGDARNGRVRAP